MVTNCTTGRSLSSTLRESTEGAALTIRTPSIPAARAYNRSALSLYDYGNSAMSSIPTTAKIFVSVFFCVREMCRSHRPDLAGQNPGGANDDTPPGAPHGPLLRGHQPRDPGVCLWGEGGGGGGFPNSSGVPLRSHQALAVAKMRV